MTATPVAALDAAAEGYWAARARYDALPDDAPDEVDEPAYTLQWDTYDAAMAIPSTSMRGLKIKVQMYRKQWFLHIEDNLHRGTLGTLLADIERLAGEASS